jgi:hypothetical protein
MSSNFSRGRAAAKYSRLVDVVSVFISGRIWGSLQSYVNHDDSAENFGSSMMVSDEVHKVGVLDIRLVNCDRHFANILCRKDKKGLALTPINHGHSQI